MMLVNDFYTVLSIEAEYQQIQATINLNPDHQLYLGHFPEQPVVPGVMQLQILKEILEEQMQQKLQVYNISQVKFLNMIIPSNQLLQLSIIFQTTEDDQLKVDAAIKVDGRITTKVKAIYSIIR